jgi:hypothetical protein
MASKTTPYPSYPIYEYIPSIISQTTTVYHGPFLPIFPDPSLFHLPPVMRSDSPPTMEFTPARQNKKLKLPKKRLSLICPRALVATWVLTDTAFRIPRTTALYQAFSSSYWSLLSTGPLNLGREQLPSCLLSDLRLRWPHKAEVIESVIHSNPATTVSPQRYILPHIYLTGHIPPIILESAPEV